MTRAELLRAAKAEMKEVLAWTELASGGADNLALTGQRITQALLHLHAAGEYVAQVQALDASCAA